MLKKIGMVLLIIVFVLCSTFIIISNNTAIYTLKTNDNKLALYKNKRVIEVYDSVDISALPETDMEILKNGIILDSPEDALSYIEDYDG